MLGARVELKNFRKIPALNQSKVFFSKFVFWYHNNWSYFVSLIIHQHVYVIH